MLLYQELITDKNNSKYESFGVTYTYIANRLPHAQGYQGRPFLYVKPNVILLSSSLIGGFVIVDQTKIQTR